MSPPQLISEKVKILSDTVTSILVVRRGMTGHAFMMAQLATLVIGFVFLMTKSGSGGR